MGYEQALMDYDLPVDRTLIKTTMFKAAGAEAATNELLQLPDPPTALFVSSGNSAIGTYRALLRAGLRMPDDISVVMYDDPDWAEAYNPPITAVAQDTRTLGMTAAELLLQRIRGADGVPQERRITTRLMLRDSCRRLSSTTG
jgi:LacI family transcriptional regulator